jgi:hypothetical protein
MSATNKIFLQGNYRDVLRDAHGRIKHDSGWRSNLVVNSARMLLAAFLKNDATSLGIQSLKIGKGESAWDDAPPKPAATDEGLHDPEAFIVPKDKLQIDYLNDSDLVVTGPTTRLQITVTLKPGEPPSVGDTKNYPLREFGLFGSLAGTPFMIDYVIHPVINKGEEDTFIRSVRLIF